MTTGAVKIGRSNQYCTGCDKNLRNLPYWRMSAGASNHWGSGVNINLCKGCAMKISVALVRRTKELIQ